MPLSPPAVPDPPVVPRKARVLLVEDDASARRTLRDHLESAGWEVAEADSVHATARFDGSQVDALITDSTLPDGDGLALLERFPSMPQLVLTRTSELGVRALERGADHFLTKPVAPPAVDALLRWMLAQARDRKRALVGARGTAMDPFLGTSPAIRRLAGEARAAAATDGPVVLAGEAFTGRTGLARWLHDQGPRRDETFVAGAPADLPRLLELAHGGTLFVDEVGDAAPDQQKALLEAITDRNGVRVIASSRHPLAERAQAGGFRADLFARLGATTLEVPPLRDRREDLPALARAVLAGIARELRRPGLTLAPAADAALSAYDWPGNLRELRNVLERAALRLAGTTIGPELLAFEEGDTIGLSLRELERRHIERVLAAEGGHVERAAHRLGMARSTLYDTLRRIGIRR